MSYNYSSTCSTLFWYSTTFVSEYSCNIFYNEQSLHRSTSQRHTAYSSFFRSVRKSVLTDSLSVCFYNGSTKGYNSKGKFKKFFIVWSSLLQRLKLYPSPLEDGGRDGEFTKDTVHVTQFVNRKYFLLWTYWRFL